MIYADSITIELSSPGQAEMNPPVEIRGFARGSGTGEVTQSTVLEAQPGDEDLDSLTATLQRMRAELDPERNKSA